MRGLSWALFSGGWLAVVASGFLAPRTFLGLIALGFDGVAFCCLMASFACVPRPAAATRRHVVGWVAAVAGAVLFPLVVDFGLGVSFHGSGAQPPDILRFPTPAGAAGHVLGDPDLMAAAALAPLALAVGLWLVGRPIGEAVVRYLLCLAAYPVIVLLLHAV